MSLRWFKPPRPSGETLRDALERLRPLGVRWCTQWQGAQPHATYSMRDGRLVKDIGQLVIRVDSGIIQAWPFAGVTYAEQLVLAGCAQRAFEKQPRKLDGWVRHRAKGYNCWATTILVKADERQDLIAQEVAAVEQRLAVVDQAWRIEVAENVR